ncbi:MAG: NYN domain-containing protein [Clostridia bacterium]|nr:NYN domain-containing protein [Clostridia bacterium]
MEKRNNFAVLIDADNVSPERFERIFGELSLWGNATYRRIYGNWADYNRSALKEKLVEYALTPVQQFNYIKGKNATDIALVIDAMDILYTGTVDGFCIVTNDSDFTRLALRLRESGMIVIGMGDDVAASSFRTACNDFVVLRESRRIAEEITEQKRIRLTAHRSAASRSGSGTRSYAGKAADAGYDEARSVDNAANDADADNTAAAPAEAIDAQPEEPVQAPEPRKVLSDRDLRVSIKEFLFECTEDDGWYSASTLVNRLKEKYPDLDIKDYADLPLFAGKRKIWTTYFLSLGFCENMQKGPSNYLLRLKADERRKLAEEKKAAGVDAEKVPEKAAVADKAANSDKPAVSDKPSTSGRRRGHRGGAAHRSAATKAEAGAEAVAPAKVEAAPETKTEAKAETKPEAKTETKPEAKAETKPETQPEVKPEVKTEAKPEAKAEVKAAAKIVTSRSRKRTSAKPAESAPVNAEKASGEAPEKAAEQAAKNAADKPAKKRVGRPPKKQTEKQAEKPAEKTAEPKPETAADKPAEKKTSRRGRPRKNASEKASAD